MSWRRWVIEWDLITYLKMDFRAKHVLIPWWIWSEGEESWRFGSRVKASRISGRVIQIQTVGHNWSDSSVWSHSLDHHRPGDWLAVASSFSVTWFDWIQDSLLILAFNTNNNNICNNELTLYRIFRSLCSKTRIIQELECIKGLTHPTDPKVYVNGFLSLFMAEASFEGRFAYCSHDPKASRGDD